jgi:hypothetical protein
MNDAPRPATQVGLTAVIIAVSDNRPRVLVVRPPGKDLANAAEALPAGPFDPARHVSLDRGLRDWVRELTGLDLRYVEQLYTFGNRYRDPAERIGGPRLLTVAYLALTHEAPVAGSGRAQWRDGYAVLPWEDWRSGRPPVIDEVIRPALDRWVAEADPAGRSVRAERAGLLFNFEGGSKRDPVLALERYELLYEAGLVAEARRDQVVWSGTDSDIGAMTTVDVGTADLAATRLGPAMRGDDRRIIATALARLRGKLAYRPLVFELLPVEFTLFQLQHVVEALAGMRLHKQNFRRMVMHAALVEATGRTLAMPRGRPAELYRFRRDIMRARSAVGIGLPSARLAD